MKDNHITDILDNSPLANISERDLKMIRSHVESCVACRRAYEAARISALLIKQHVEEADEASRNANPFFQTRVLAAWREQRAMNSVPTFRRLWNAANALVAGMVATTAALAVLSFVAPAERAVEQAVIAGPYSVEAVVLNETQGPDQVTDDQVLSTIYAIEDEGE